jgi:serine/threonine-protein kinase
MASPGSAGSLVGQRLGKYEILALLAIGGTAEIYLARIGGEAGFQKYVVIKCLLDHLADDNEFVRMFLDEARLGAQLHHSNIVQTLELGRHGNRYYMVMEYLAGLSLSQLARKSSERVPSGLIPTDIVLALAAQACAGLHYAHQRTAPDGSPLNIVHRDVSPQNLVISFDGVLKIVDFGIAKAELRQTHTRSGTIKGKFAYMSPEQCQAEPIDRRTDVFALGTILHEVLTARRLFKRTTTYETYQAILKGSVPPPSTMNPDVGPDVDEVVLRALAYRKEDRYDTAEAMGEALHGVLHRRGAAVSSGDVARFFDQHFASELDDHALRMRELLEGTKGTASRSVVLSWDGEGEVDPRMKAPHDDLSDDGPIDPPVDAFDHSTFGNDDTHIELNPAEMVARLHSAEPSTPVADLSRGEPLRPTVPAAATTAPAAIRPRPRSDDAKTPLPGRLPVAPAARDPSAPGALRRSPALGSSPASPTAPRRAGTAPVVPLPATGSPRRTALGAPSAAVVPRPVTPRSAARPDDFDTRTSEPGGGEETHDRRQTAPTRTVRAGAGPDAATDEMSPLGERASAAASRGHPLDVYNTPPGNSPLPGITARGKALSSPTRNPSPTDAPTTTTEPVPALPEPPPAYPPAPLFAAPPPYGAPPPPAYAAPYPPPAPYPPSAPYGQGPTPYPPPAPYGQAPAPYGQAPAPYPSHDAIPSDADTMALPADAPTAELAMPVEPGPVAMAAMTGYAGPPMPASDATGMSLAPQVRPWQLALAFMLAASIGLFLTWAVVDFL